MEITPTMLGTTAKAKKLEHELDSYVNAMTRNKSSIKQPTIYLSLNDMKWILKQVNSHRAGNGLPDMNSLALCTYRGCFLRPAAALQGEGE